jgi:hypothetical protein
MDDKSLPIFNLDSHIERKTAVQDLGTHNGSGAGKSGAGNGCLVCELGPLRIEEEILAIHQMEEISGQFKAPASGGSASLSAAEA